jgi:adenylylsulfate kinase
MSAHIHPIFERLVTKKERERFLNQKSGVYWFTGLSGSGKSTIVEGVERKLFDLGYFAQVIDGDNMRSGVCSNLSFSIEDRRENIRRIAEVAKLYNSSGIITLCSFISPTIAIRKMAQVIIGAENYSEIYVNADLDVCEDRDVKGLYKKARAGEIKGFTGIDSQYEKPFHPTLEINTSNQEVAQSVATVLDFVLNKSAIG